MIFGLICLLPVVLTPNTLLFEMNLNLLGCILSYFYVQVVLNQTNSSREAYGLLLTLGTEGRPVFSLKWP